MDKDRVLASIRVAEAYCYDAGGANAARNCKEARTAVAEVYARVERLEAELAALRAREILAALPKDGATCFNLLESSRDTLWRAAVKRAGIADLPFHDSRAEAIWRMSRKLDVLELARVIGHRDVRSLMIYYQTDADDLADRL